MKDKAILSRRDSLKTGALGGLLATSSFLIGPTEARAKEVSYSVGNLFRVYNSKYLKWTTEQDSLSQISGLIYSFSPHYWSEFYVRSLVRQEGNSFYSALVRYHKGKARLFIEKQLPGQKALILAETDIPALYKGACLEISARGDNFTEIKARLRDRNTSTDAWQLTVRDEDKATLLKGKGAGYSFWVTGLKEGYFIEISDFAYNFKDYSVEEDRGAVYPEFRELAFEDHFQGDSVDTSKWNVWDKTYVGYDSGYIVKENAQVRDSSLYLSVTKRDTPIYKRDGKERPYDTAYLTSLGKFSQVYGRWEFRAKIPCKRDISAGIWSGFWLRTDDKALQGEVDIAEAFGSYNPLTKTSEDVSNKATATIHFSQTGKDKKAKVMHSLGAGVLDEEFHIWAFERTPERFSFFLDGEKYWEVLVEDAPEKFRQAFPENAPLHMRLNIQATSPGTYWGGINSDTVLPRDLVVDYVKAWKYTGS